jgi:hypothetical protein
MSDSHRKHVSLSEEAIVFLESYQRTHQLPNFSATVERAAQALKRQTMIEGYEQFAFDYANSSELQQDAQSWLEIPMLEAKP